MKNPTTTVPQSAPINCRTAPRFASLAEFLAAEKKRFQQVFGGVDWEEVKPQDADKPTS